MSNLPKKPLKKKDKISRTIAKLNILEKLLEQPMVSVKKTLGDPELVDEVNRELRTYIQKQMNSIFNPESNQVESPFTDEEIEILKEVARMTLTEPELPVDTPSPVPADVPAYVPSTAKEEEPEQPSSPYIGGRFQARPRKSSANPVRDLIKESYGVDIADPSTDLLKKREAMRKFEKDRNKPQK